MSALLFQTIYSNVNALVNKATITINVGHVAKRQYITNLMSLHFYPDSDFIISI